MVRRVKPDLQSLAALQRPQSLEEQDAAQDLDQMQRLAHEQCKAIRDAIGSLSVEELGAVNRDLRVILGRARR